MERVRLTPVLLAGVFCWADTGCNSPRIHSAPLAAQAAPAVGAPDAAGLPPAGGADDATERALYHQVREGETLDDVAGIYGLTASRLLQVNGLDSPNGLKPGQLIYIPRSH
jgi:LysM repeat protein